MTYNRGDEEAPLKRVDLVNVLGHALEVLHFVDEVGRVLRLHVEEHQPEVDSDAGHQRAEVPAAHVELLVRGISHFSLITY